MIIYRRPFASLREGQAKPSAAPVAECAVWLHKIGRGDRRLDPARRLARRSANRVDCSVPNRSLHTCLGSAEINAQFSCFFGELLLPLQLKPHGGIVQAPTLMQEFVLGQKWMMADDVFGTFIGEVIEVSEDGASGAVLISDDEGNEVDTFTGTAAEFQASGEWRRIEE